MRSASCTAGPCRVGYAAKRDTTLRGIRRRARFDVKAPVHDDVMRLLVGMVRTGQATAPRVIDPQQQRAASCLVLRRCCAFACSSVASCALAATASRLIRCSSGFRGRTLICESLPHSRWCRRGRAADTHISKQARAHTHKRACANARTDKRARTRNLAHTTHGRTHAQVRAPHARAAEG